MLACLYLVLPWTSGRDIEQYFVAGALLGIGIVLWGVTVIANRAVRVGAGDLTKVG